jgi:hypothetical protein
MYRRINRYIVSLFTCVALLGTGVAHASTPTLGGHTQGAVYQQVKPLKRLHTGRLHTGRLHTG